MNVNRIWVLSILYWVRGHFFTYKSFVCWEFIVKWENWNYRSYFARISRFFFLIFLSISDLYSIGFTPRLATVGKPNIKILGSPLGMSLWHNLWLQLVSWPKLFNRDCQSSENISFNAKIVTGTIWINQESFIVHIVDE